ncbi:MAG: hypothetical protein QOD99_2712 [Chthoniobacter sp.]|jgi:CRP-like cAMP-binding protein|nr:hypothetical protein [Chthoniobacter sp.]
MENIESIVARQPFLRGIKPEHFHILDKCASFAQFKPEEVIFSEGGQADRFYLINTGLVSLETRIPGQGLQTLQTIGPGDALGWSWMFEPHRWHFTARALENGEFVSFDAKQLHEQIEANHELGYELWKRFARVVLQRLQATRRQLLDVNRASH